MSAYCSKLFFILKPALYSLLILGFNLFVIKNKTVLLYFLGAWILMKNGIH